MNQKPIVTLDIQALQLIILGHEGVRYSLPKTLKAEVVVQASFYYY
jgi:hypothetical protein